MSTKTIADRLHESYWIIDHVEQVILNAFKKYEPEIYEKLEFEIGADEYDNSIEIYIATVLPYPYEPCWEIRDMIYSLGFGIVYWNFIDINGNYTEEIRGEEPRRYKIAPERYSEEFCKEFWNKWGISATDKRFDGTWFNKYQRKSTKKTNK